MTAQKIWTISEVNAAVRDLLENTFMPLWLQGEVGTLNIYRSGHVYLTLKDAKCQVRGVFFNGAKKAREMNLQIGAQVEAFGSLSVYEVRGEYQFVIRSIRPMGIGDLQRRFEELKSRLQAEGLFDESRKQPIPMLPRRIGVVSSPDGAAIRDFLQVVNRRFPNIHIKIYPAACQGNGAEKQLAAGVNFFNRVGNVDVIVVTRGGGSIEDLWAFNEEVLAREIAASRIPVISAVGHEIDFTISDFVADLRVPTPSAAAELVVGRQQELENTITNLNRRLSNAMQLVLERMTRRYQNAVNSYVFREPQHLLREKQQRVDELLKSMEYAISRQLEAVNARFNQLQTRLKAVVPSAVLSEKRQQLREYQTLLRLHFGRRLAVLQARLDQLTTRLNAVNPAVVLNRGYAILTDPETGKTVSDPEQKPGTMLTATVAEGVMSLEVKNGKKQSLWT